MGTKQLSDCVFWSRSWERISLIKWYSLISFYFLRSISLVTLMIPLAVSVKAYLIYFFCSVVNYKLLLCESCEIIRLSRPHFVDSKIVIWGLTFVTSSPSVKKTSCIRLPKENFFSPNNASETYISFSWRHQKLSLVASQLQDSTFLIFFTFTIPLQKGRKGAQYEVSLNLNIMTQLIWAPLFKRCKICQEIDASW